MIEDIIPFLVGIGVGMLIAFHLAHLMVRMTISKMREQLEAEDEPTSINGKEVVDAVIIWWRDEDGDLVDELVDALTFLTEDGPIWVLTPKVGREGHVEASDIQDAAPTAGLSQTQSLRVASNWTGTKLVHRKGSKK